MDPVISHLRVVASDQKPGDDDASLTLSTGSNEIVGFCHPCSVRVGDLVPNRLGVLDAAELKASYFQDAPASIRDELEVQFLSRLGHFSYKGRGVVTDRELGIVSVLGFLLVFGEVPCDGWIDFQVSRLDAEDSGVVA